MSKEGLPSCFFGGEKLVTIAAAAGMTFPSITALLRRGKAAA